MEMRQETASARIARQPAQDLDLTREIGGPPLPDADHPDHDRETPDRSLPKLVIAGATGFVGHHLIPRLESRFRIVALTRSASRPATAGGGPGSSVHWRHCDL